MTDTISLPHPIRSEAERENLITAINAARCMTTSWDMHGNVSPLPHDLLPPVEPMPELAEPWWTCRQMPDGTLRLWNACTLREGAESLLSTLGSEYRVYRAAVVEVIEPEPVRQVAPSGRLYRLWDNGNGICATLSDGTLVVDCGCKVAAIPLEDVSFVAALLDGGAK